MPLRSLFALSGIGFLGVDGGAVRVAAHRVLAAARRSFRGCGASADHACPCWSGGAGRAALLDQTVLRVRGDGPGPAVRVPLRSCRAVRVGLLGVDGGAVRLTATGTWLRLDARYGGVVRRQITALPLLVGSGRPTD